MFRSLRRKKKKKDLHKEHEGLSRTFTDPARKIYHELRRTEDAGVEFSPRFTSSRVAGEPIPKTLSEGQNGGCKGGLARNGGCKEATQERVEYASSPSFSSNGRLIKLLGAPKIYEESENLYEENEDGYDETDRLLDKRKEIKVIAAESNNENGALTKHHALINNRINSSSHRNQNAPYINGTTGLPHAPPGSDGHPPRLDMVYVTERIISLAFPPGVDDSSYKLHLREVAHMLTSKHGDGFRVFDLSPGGEVSHFLPRVTNLGWAHGLSPPLEKLCAVCKALDSWLNESQYHVAVLHSRSGYAKLGIVVAAYMHYTNICASTDQALDRYAMKRFFDDKIGGLQHPSQKRYVQYFAGLLSGLIRINSNPLYLHTLTLYGVPHYDPRGGCSFFVKVYQGLTPVYTSGVYNVTQNLSEVSIAFDTGVQLRGDVLLKAYHRTLSPPSRELIFRLQFHTCAVSDKLLPFSKMELDYACNDMRFPSHGGIELMFSPFPCERPCVSNVSCDKSPCDVTSWDSYEKLTNDWEHFEEEQSLSSAPVSHTLGPLDGSLYATVSKQRGGRGPPTPTQSTHSPGAPNGRYAASIDSGIASSNSAGTAPISPPTSDSSRASAESRTAPVAAPAARTGGGGTTAGVQVDARHLDELLAGMLLDIQSIPDLRPCQTPAPDIDSIRCPDFNRQRPVTSSYNRSTTSTMRSDHSHSHSNKQSIPPLSPINGHSGSTTHDSFFDTSFGSSEVPYHSRVDSKPFSYGTPFSSTRYSNESGSNTQTPQTPPSPSIHRRDSRDTLGSTRVGLESPRLVRKMVGNVGANQSMGDNRSRRSPSPDSIARMGSLKRERSQTLTTKIMANASESPTNTLGRSSSMTRSDSRLDDDVVDSSYGTDSLSRSQSMNASWLQSQQMKLLERREARVRADRGPREARMMSELRSRMNRNPVRESSDGYMSDTTHFSETSRETSPLKSFPPLTINTTAAQSPQKPPIAHSTPARVNSAPSSPVMPPRNFSNIHQGNYSTLKGVSRKHSDISHDRERAFVSVKRAHDMSRSDATDNDALQQLQTSPLGHINYSIYGSQNSGLLTTTSHSDGKQSGDEWQSDMEGSSGVHRPITPAFPPATPTTPYLNQGLPPKSPTLQRKEYNSLRSSSPFGSHLRHEINGHGSPAPSLYHGQSRRSSLTSLNDSDVISSHPKFVKDISKFWYKPSISRDDAINILREKSPGTFVVRDSNSFPGAFGLALKVSTPPPNVTSKSSDPTNELVRHFLIEPTSRGVRLKGCANEPVFGSLSALVYQHSITALALPCRLILPDRDPEGHSTDLSKPDPKTDTAHLLLQGAACTVLYLFSTDTESLTGPQAIKRAVQIMLASKACPVVVHFKVSAQGITLTDSTRQLFFRRHYPVNAVSHCGLDPDDRRWPQKDHNGDTIGSLRMFGFVAKKGSSRTENQCHILAELEAEQPATAICNFVTKVMMTSINRAKLL